jgi:LmbE family N-acetylglucosaminyl deacetylase
MISLRFPERKKPLRLLCLGAHSDDIEIGCGGSVLKIVRDHPDTQCDWVVFSATGARRKEARAGAAAFLKGGAGYTVILRSFRDGYFPAAGAEIKDFFEELKKRDQPDLIFTHHRADLHQDHRLVSELTWNTFRDHAILEYEIPKYDGDLTTPNVYVPLEAALVKAKLRGIRESFPSQAGNGWFSDETFKAVLRLRGIESNAPSGYAEGFHARKLCLFWERGT